MYITYIMIMLHYLNYPQITYLGAEMCGSNMFFSSSCFSLLVDSVLVPSVQLHYNVLIISICINSTFSRHKGVVSDVIDGTAMLSVDLDDGRAKTVELGKQGIRFVPQKQKRLKS